MIALIPARAGSKRCPGKNVRILAGHPLIAYTIAAARASGVCDAVIVSTDDAATKRLAYDFGADYVQDRAARFAGDESPDIDWVRECLSQCDDVHTSFAILRPTSPFRTAATIRRAYAQFQALPAIADSLRAVEPVTQHPGKMWSIPVAGQPMYPVLAGYTNGVPHHSCPTQILPKYYVQNSSLEMAKRHCVERGSISGDCVFPFFTEGLEGFAIDTELDFTAACYHANRADVLPTIEAHVR
jgi:CMP-N,N'-diacetyllegionaminic acid synthase